MDRIGEGERSLKGTRPPDERAREEVDDRWFYSYLPNNVSGGGTQPLIPIFVTEGLGGSVAQVGIVTAASSAASVPSSIAWGEASDRLRRRRLFIMLGFIGMGVSFILMALAQNVEQYLLANIVMGLLATASGPIATVLIMETSKEERWAAKIGRFSKIGGWGWVFGLVIGAVWLSVPSNSQNTNALRMLFVISALLSFLSAYMAYAWIDEHRMACKKVKPGKPVNVCLRTHEKSHFLPMRVLHLPKRGHLRKLKFHGLCARHDLTYYFIISFVFTTAFIMFYTVFPIFVVGEVGIPPGATFGVYLASSIASAFLYERAGEITERQGAKKTQMLALSARVVLIPSFLVLLVVTPGNIYVSVALLIALQAMMGACWAFIAVSGTTLVTELAPSAARGESLGLYTAVQGIASIIGALAGGLVAFSLGYRFAFLIPMALVLVALVLMARIKLITKEPLRVEKQKV
jgi:MFS family permease